MLNNPNWDKPIKTEPSLEGFIAWLETKPPEEEYNWRNDKECAVGQYAQSLGLCYLYISYLDRGGIAYHQPRTFGAAAKRAKKQLGLVARAKTWLGIS